MVDFKDKHSYMTQQQDKRVEGWLGEGQTVI